MAPHGVVAFRLSLSAPGQYKRFREIIPGINDPTGNHDLPHVDHLIASLEVFVFKFPSPLKFDAEGRSDDSESVSNLKTPFGLGQIPRDAMIR